MNRKSFIQLHKVGLINLPKTKEYNPLDSDTDPTQDIPVKNIIMAANGMPLNVKDRKTPINNLHVEEMTSIEKRNNDQFDQLGELQNSIKQVSQKGVTIEK